MYNVSGHTHILLSTVSITDHFWTMLSCMEFLG